MPLVSPWQRLPSAPLCFRKLLPTPSTSSCTLFSPEKKDKREVMELGPKLFSSALKLLPDSASLWQNLAMSFQSCWVIDKAEETKTSALDTIKKAIALEPRDSTHCSLGCVGTDHRETLYLSTCFHSSSGTESELSRCGSYLDTSRLPLLEARKPPVGSLMFQTSTEYGSLSRCSLDRSSPHSGATGTIEGQWICSVILCRLVTDALEGAKEAPLTPNLA